MFELTGYEAPGDRGTSYLINGQKMVRVTTILDQIHGQALLAWSAKQAALKCASWLVQGGLFTDGSEIDSELYEFTEAQAYLQIDHAEAIKEAMNWKSNMRESERYRDERARIGSLGHVWHKHFALGTVPIEKGERTVDWLAEQAARPGFVPEPVMERFLERGWSREKVAFDHAKQAWDRITFLWSWLDKMKPDYHGAEAVVFNDEEEYAGQCDAWARFTKRNWTQNGLEWYWPGDEVDLTIDLKFTKALPQNVILQMLFYRAAKWVIVPDLLEVHEQPETDGVACVHIAQNAPVNFKYWWDAAELDVAYENGALALLDYWRWTENRPKPQNSRRPRQERAAKRTEVRKCPI